jgi:predicted alpha/beta superfamily hydrolase
LFGHSLGGLFAVYALFRRPDLFDSYLITSPALYWDRGAIWNVERAFAEAHKDLRARVLLAGGSLDEQHTAMVRQLDDVLRSRKYGGLEWHIEIFSGETHSSVGVVSLTRGIRWLYGPPLPSP